MEGFYNSSNETKHAVNFFENLFNVISKTKIRCEVNTKVTHNIDLRNNSTIKGISKIDFVTAFISKRKKVTFRGV